MSEKEKWLRAAGAVLRATEEKANMEWEKATPARRRNATRQAEEFLEKTFRFRGERRSRLQRQAWPRNDSLFDDGTPIVGIPREFEKALSFAAKLKLIDAPFNALTVAALIAVLDPIITDPEPH
jgi:hypothetical protein